jgi:uncharacterized repeat protein (TIGR04138 family)
MSMHEQAVRHILQRDPRYPPEAYDFVLTALYYTQRRLGKPDKPQSDVVPQASHVSGRELLEGIRLFALEHFGLMARTVFRMWNIHHTDDFGNIVYNLMDEQILTSTPTDRREDFHNVFDLDEALTRGFDIEWEE